MGQIKKVEDNAKPQKAGRKRRIKVVINTAMNTCKALPDKRKPQAQK